MKLMLYKEFKEGLRSFRLPGLLLLALFFALTDPPTVKYMDKIMGAFVKDMVVELPPVTALGAYTQYIGDVSMIVAIAAILTTMGLAAKERGTGVAAWLLTRPISRSSYILSKAVYSVISTIIAVFVSGLVCVLYTYTIIGSLDTGDVLLSLLALSTYLVFPVIVTLIVSAVSGKSGMAAMAGFGTLWLGDLVGWALGMSDIYWTPFSLKHQIAQAANGMANASYGYALATTWAAIAIIVVVGQKAFKRKAI